MYIFTVTYINESNQPNRKRVEAHAAITSAAIEEAAIKSQALLRAELATL